MKKTIGILAIVAILMIVTATIVGARGGTAAPVDTTQLVDETPTNWFVQFASKPSVEGTSAKTLAAEKSKFESSASALGLDYTERYAFSSLWNGISISMPASELSKLTGISGVKAVYPVLKIPMPEVTVGETPDLFTSVGMIGADVAQNEMGLTGAGVRVAIMDTGVDYDNPDLGGGFGFFYRVFKGYDFVGDDYNGDNTPVPDNDPDDCYGHGTHVAGIVGANGDVVGVAPGVRFGAYRVFGCEGYTQSDIMLAAMEMALADGMDVLNMSIGSAYSWPQYPTAVASDALVDAGMVVVASAGNEGSSGLYASGAPGLGEKVISVASFDNTEQVLPYAEVEGQPNALNAAQVAFVPMTYTGPIPTSGTEEIVYVGQGCDADLPLLQDPTGKIALIVRGVCSFAEKAQNGIDAGATGVVIYNNTTGIINGTLGSVLDGVTPVVGISQADGQMIAALGQPVYWTWTDQLISQPIATAGLISSFSSYGLSPDLAIKPDIGAPGGSIYSTLPVEQGGHGTMSGTSMASPHIAGAAALLLEYRPLLTPATVRDRLLNSADPQLWSLGPSYGLLDEVYRQGAGLADVPGAATAKTVITPAKIALGESSSGPQTWTLTVQNQTRHTQTWNLDWVSAVAAEGVLVIQDFWTTDEVLTFSPNPLVIPAMSSGTVAVTFTPPTQDDTGAAGVPFSTLYNGWITFSPPIAKVDEANDDQQSYAVPYAGFVGDYQDIVHLYNTYGVPVLVDKDWNTVPEGFVFTMIQGNIPHILVHLEHQATVLSVEVLNSVTGRRARPIFSEVIHEDWMERNSGTGYVFDFPWDGTRIVRDRTFALPDGNYQLVLKVLKALGDPDNPADWETWTSPMFTIQRKH